MVNPSIVLPMLYGTDANYQAIAMKDANTIYICVDTGNMYLGTSPIANYVLFCEDRSISEDVGNDGQYCITPYGVYYKVGGVWELYSSWYVDADNNLVVNEQIIPIFDIATTTTPGVVKSTAEGDGTVNVSSDGTMNVNGWDTLVDQLRIRRVDAT